ncbi:unnamed protein product [Bursaphelenchus okinawaensis]|uniref:Uncharacterized protein n=1 Tax=Bursaphelenchus okinawaensis TaxID=465554 RepID=A0A811LVB6_9BILA|nr:unnamed protein product [Bursaphelenchus okinawaensis]CAG9127875.1 unnamed protein product [Bursaphelenchus okinawaensis]
MSRPFKSFKKVVFGKKGDVEAEKDDQQAARTEGGPRTRVQSDQKKNDSTEAAKTDDSGRISFKDLEEPKTRKTKEKNSKSTHKSHNKTSSTHVNIKSGNKKTIEKRTIKNNGNYFEGGISVGYGKR